MKSYLFPGAKNPSKLAIGPVVLALPDVEKFPFAGGGRIVRVCDVEVMEEVVLPLLAMVIIVMRTVVEGLCFLQFSNRNPDKLSVLCYPHVI
jgi:hypothetical protein